MAEAAAFMAISQAVSTGVSYLFPAEGPRIEDLSVSASTYGNLIPRIYGTMRCGANMIWSAPIEERKKKKRAGKGGSYYNEYTYYADFAMAFCYGPVTSLRRVWADGKLIYDSTGTSTVEAGKFNMRVYKGTETQLPDPTIETGSSAFLGGSKFSNLAQPLQSKTVGYTGSADDYTPAYRGLCYVVFEDFFLGDFGNRIPQMAAEVYVGPNGLTQTLDVDFQPATPVNLSAGYQGDEIAADFDRGYYYLTTNESVQGVSGLRRIRFDNGKQDRFIAVEDMALPPRPGDGLGAGAGVIDNVVLLTTTADGSVIVSGRGSNYEPIFRLDPVSYTAVSAYGFDGGFASNGPDPLRWSHQGAVSTDQDGREYLLTHALVGEELSLFDITDGGFTHITKIAPPQTSNTTSTVITGARGARGEPRFFVSQQDSLSNEHQISVFELTASAGMVLKTVITTGDPGERADCKNLIYDGGAPGVIVSYTNISTNQRGVLKYGLDAQAVVWTILDFPSTSLHSNQTFRARIENNELALHSGGKLYLLDTLTGDYIDRDADIYSTIDPDYRPVSAWDTDGFLGYDLNNTTANPTGTLLAIFDSRRQLLVGVGGAGTKSRHIFTGAFGSADTNLGNILELMLLDAGRTPEDYDMSGLFDVPVRGYGFAREVDIKSAIQELQAIYLFDVVESDGRLVGIKRGKETADQVIDSRLLGSQNEDKADFWKEIRAAENDLPASIALAYMNPDADYETATAVAKRMSNPIATMHSSQQAKTQTSVVMTPTEAKNRVHSMLYSVWGERTTHETRWPWALMALDPADMIEVQFPDGRVYFDRLHEIDIGADLIQRVQSRGQDSGAYSFALTGDGGGSGRGQIIVPAMPAVGFIMNTPLLRDLDGAGQDYSQFYVAVGNSGSSSFRGATVYRSVDSYNYETMLQEKDEVEWGTILGVVPPPSHGAFSLDWETRIDIAPAVSWFDLESITDAQLWEGLNLCLIGGEVMQFRDAVENADGTWTIWNLLRGRRGTEYACSTHAAGERFVYLDANTINLEGEGLNAHTQERWFKPVGAGRSLVETRAIQIDYQARDLMPYAPSDIRRAVEGDGSITLDWKRRTRLGGNLQDGTPSVPLNETSESYEVYILDAPFDGDLSVSAPPASFRRKYETTVPNVSYPLADINTDVFDPNVDTLHVVVYQLSGAIGRGFPGVRTIEPWAEF